MSGPDVHVVSYGEREELEPLLASLAVQTQPPGAVRVWHNGPQFPWRPPSDGAGGAAFPDVLTEGRNLGFGGGHNRLFARSTADVVILANPDLELASDCLERLCSAFDRHPDAVLAGAMLLDTASPARVNAYGLCLTWDLLGINPDRGRLPAEVRGTVEEDASLTGGGGRYLAPSGALLAVHRRRFAERVGGETLFPESLFLFKEDVALGLRVRAHGGAVVFCADARAVHRFSGTVGRRSALKLYHVERNRLWIARVLLGDRGAAASLPITALRYLAYAAAHAGGRLRGAPMSQASSAPPADHATISPALAAAFARALRDGLLAPVPSDLRAYLADVPRGWQALRPYVAELSVQLADPIAQ